MGTQEYFIDTVVAENYSDELAWLGLAAPLALILVGGMIFYVVRSSVN